MKRSEAINKIESFLTNYYNMGPIDAHDSEGLLELLEEAGIVRPIKTVSKSETLVINKFGQVVEQTEDSEVIEIGWENEEK